MIMTQFQHYELARRRLAEANVEFLNLVNHPTNPLAREDLARNIERRPGLWSRYAGFLDTLPSRGD